LRDTANLGVDLFFIVSGFVIMMTARSGTVRSFVASRAARLLPAFWVCCSVTFLVLAVAGDWRGWADFAANMTMAGLLFPIRFMDGSYWILTYEIRFYALVAAVLALRQIHRAERLLVFWLGAAFVVTAFPLRYVSALVMSDYAAHFIAGAMLFIVWEQGMTIARAAVLMGCLALAEYHAVRLAGILSRREGTTFEPLVSAVILATAFGIMLAIALRRTGALARGRWIALGALTYPLYLLHQAVGVILIQRGMPWWMVTLLMIIAAWLVNTQIEARSQNPMRRYLERISLRSNPAAQSS
jgi:peptidoglycan/LPS O-acetylase OafA/YrhL